MSKVFITIAALSLMACEQPYQPGEAVNDAEQWANELKIQTTIIGCVNVNGADAAYCSVMVENNHHWLHCWKYNHQCYLEP